MSHLDAGCSAASPGEGGPREPCGESGGAPEGGEGHDQRKSDRVVKAYSYSKCQKHVVFRENFHFCNFTPCFPVNDKNSLSIATTVTSISNNQSSIAAENFNSHPGKIIKSVIKSTNIIYNF